MRFSSKPAHVLFVGVLLRFNLVFIAACAMAQSQSVYGIRAYAGTDFDGDSRLAIHAPLVQPQGVAAEKDGSIVFADAGDNRVRRILPNGFVLTIVATELRTPYGVAIAPNRDIYIADLGNARVLRLAPDGSTEDIRGFEQPRNVAVNANGVLYVSDFKSNTVYRLRSDGTLEPAITEKLNGPAGLAFDPADNLYIADSGNQRVLAIKDGTAKMVLSDFGAVTSIAIDQGGRLYAAGGDRVAVVSPAGDVTTIRIDADEVALDVHGNLITVAHRQVRSYRLGVITTLAGNSTAAYTGDGRPSEEWRFMRPTSAVRDTQGNLYISDTGTGRIRRIDAEGILSTLVATLAEPAYLALDAQDRLYFSDSKAGVIYRIEFDGTRKVFSRGSGSKPFRQPSGLAFDRHGQLYVADTGNGMLRRIAPDGFVSSIAGGGTSREDGFGTSIEVTAPVGVAVDSDGAVWFTESGRLRVLTTDGRVSTVPGIPLIKPRGLHFDAERRLVLTDAGSHRIIRVNRDGAWEVLAGSGEQGLSGDDGAALKAKLDGPSDVFLESDGSILVVDTGNHRIRKLDELTTAPLGSAGFVQPESPTLVGAIENGDGSVNSADHPSPRTGALKIRLTGVTSSPVEPTIAAEIASLDIPVSFVERNAGQVIVGLQLPGGFLPSGSSPLVLRVNGAKVTGVLNVVIR